MQNFTRKSSMLLVLLLPFAFGLSCNSGSAPLDIDPIVTHRMVWIESYAIDNSNNATAGGGWGAVVQATDSVKMATAAFIQVSTILDDEHWSDAFTKAELDYGDGEGWKDVTWDVANKWDLYYTAAPPDPDLSTWDQHTYTEPGTYTIRARVTYWDGEVVYSTPDTEVTVVVSEPSAPAT